MSIFVTEDFEIPSTETEPLEEESDLMMVAEAVDFAFENIDTLLSGISGLEAAKNSSPAHQLQALRLNAIIRESIASQYELSTVSFLRPVMESMDASQLIVALEEESSSSKGILTKIIDAVVNAFKWLWDKITGFFSKPKDESEKRNYVDELKTLIESGDELTETLVIENKMITNGFSYVGKALSVGQIEAVMKEHELLAKPLVVLIGAVSDKGAKAKDVSNEFKPDAAPEKINEAIKHYLDGVGEAVKSGMKDPYKPAEHGNYGFVKEGSAVDAANSYVFGPIVTQKGPSLLGIIRLPPGKRGVGGYASGFNAPKGGEKEAEAVKVTIGDRIGIVYPFSEEIVKYRASIDACYDDIKGKMSSMDSNTKAIISTLEKLKNDATRVKTQEGTSAIQDFTGFTKGVGKIQMSLMATMAGLQTSIVYFEAVLSEVIAKAPKLQKAKAKATKSDEEAKPTEEAKPAEAEAEAKPAAEPAPAPKRTRKPKAPAA